jgi:glutamine synthetase
VLNTIAAEAIDSLAEEVENKTRAGASLEEAVLAVVKDAWSANKRIVFDGDNYSDEWHAEAEQRGLANLKQTPDALPWLLEDQTVTLFSNYGVLSQRELESRFEVFAEQYATKINIEAETAASIARTMLLPAAVRHLADLKAAGHDDLIAETQQLISELYTAIIALETANIDHPAEEGLELAKYMRDTVIPAMDATREVADKLERIVSDDLWPLPKYSEMLFIK